MATKRLKDLSAATTFIDADLALVTVDVVGGGTSKKAELGDLQTFFTTGMIATPNFGVNISPVSELVHFHSTSGSATKIQFTNVDTGTTTNDGFIIGLENDESATIRNMENTPLKLWTNNIEQLRIDGGGTLSTYTGQTEIGGLNSGNRFAWIDLHADDTYTDYALRLFRDNTGANAESRIIHRGTGDFRIETLEASSLSFHAQGSQKMRLNPDGSLGLGLTTAQEHLHMYENSSGDNLIQISNSTTGGGASQGIIFGLGDSSSSAVFWNYYNQYMRFGTNNNEALRITNDLKLATNAEASPDCDPGGVTLQQGANDGKILTFKNSDVSHGMTDFAETDTYFFAEKFTTVNGGALLWGLSDIHRGFGIYGVGSGENTTTGGAAQAATQIIGGKKSGTGATALTADGNVLVIENFGSVKHIFKGDGDIYTDTGFVGSYDKEDDIQLVRAINQKYNNNIKFDDRKILKKYELILEKLGIIKNGFMSDHKIKMLSLGSIGQMFNIIKNIAKDFGYTESQLLEFSKDYS
jgi:hypothetical protein